MKRNNLYKGVALLAFSAFMAACSNEDAVDSSVVRTADGQYLVTAQASLDNANTRLAYTDEATDANPSGGLKVNWEKGDRIKVYQGTQDCAFETQDGGSTTATFTGEVPNEPTDATKWTAIYANDDRIGMPKKSDAPSTRVDGRLTGLYYFGQDGTLANLKYYDFMVARSQGKTPSLAFSSKSRLSYFIRLKVPVGIKKVEFNVGRWNVYSDSIKCGYLSENYVVGASLAAETTESTTVYLAVPAVDYSKIGLIITILNADGSKSQGKVISKDLSGLGGYIGTYDMSGLTLMNRPKYSDAVKLGLSADWAPFNVGAESPVPEAFGGLYGWADPTGEKTSNNNDDYPSANPPADISGTKYDIARVKWGIQWRLPSYDQLFELVSSNSKCTSEWTTLNGVNGRLIKSNSNGNTLFFPAAGARYGNDLSEKGDLGCCWSGMLKPGFSHSANNLILNKSTVAIQNFDCYAGLSVRPVLDGPY